MRLEWEWPVVNYLNHFKIYFNFNIIYSILSNSINQKFILNYHIHNWLKAYLQFHDARIWSYHIPTMKWKLIPNSHYVPLPPIKWKLIHVGDFNVHLRNGFFFYANGKVPFEQPLMEFFSFFFWSWWKTNILWYCMIPSPTSIMNQMHSFSSVFNEAPLSHSIRPSDFLGF